MQGDLSAVDVDGLDVVISVGIRTDFLPVFDGCLYILRLNLFACGIIHPIGNVKGDGETVLADSPVGTCAVNDFVFIGVPLEKRLADELLQIRRGVQLVDVNAVLLRVNDLQVFAISAARRTSAV